MGLLGGQDSFDRNGDGHLSSAEWGSWYANEYGVDMELAERAELASAEESYEDWLAEQAETLQSECQFTLGSAKRRFPSWDEELNRLTWQMMLYEMTLGLIRGNKWNSSFRSPGGLFLSRRVFYPYRQLMQAMLESCPGLGAMQELQRAMQAREPLHRAEGALAEGECGLFWQRVIAKLPLCQRNYPSECINLTGGASRIFACFTDETLRDQRIDEQWQGLKWYWASGRDGAANKPAHGEQPGK